MKNTFEQQIYEIFGTTDPKELRRLSKDAEQYQQLAKKEALRHAAGRKPAFSLPQIIQMAALQQQLSALCRQFFTLHSSLVIVLTSFSWSLFLPMTRIVCTDYNF